MFTCRLYTDDPKVRSVIVRHRQMKQEEIYPCIHGIAYPRICSEDAAVVFQDEKQRRYAATVDYNLTPLFDDREMVPAVLEKGRMNRLCFCITVRVRRSVVRIWEFFRNWSFHRRLLMNIRG